MSDNDLSAPILATLQEAGVPLVMRQIQGMMMFKDPDVSTFDIARTVSRMLQAGMIIEDDSFRYTCAQHEPCAR